MPLNAKGVSNAAELEYMLTLSGARILVLPEVETIKKLDHIVPEVLRESRLGIVLGGGSGGSPRGWMCCNELCKEAVGDASCTNGHEDGNETGTQATVRGGGKDSDATDKMEALAMIIFTSGQSSILTPCRGADVLPKVPPPTPRAPSTVIRQSRQVCCR